MKIRISCGRLDGNHHGRKVAAPDGSVSWETRRGGALFVALGRDSYMIREGRRLIGRRLWIYWRTGACVNLDVYAHFDRSPYPPGHKYGPKPWPVDGVQL